MSRLPAFFLFGVLSIAAVCAQDPPADPIRQLQQQAIETASASWGYWGVDPGKFDGFKNHSNRLVPVYTFGVDLSSVKDQRSLYRNAAAIEHLYGRLPTGTLNTEANYFDQTQILHLQEQAVADGKKYIFLVVFDGMDWQTSRLASIAKLGEATYDEGRGNGLHFQDYLAPVGDFGSMVTSPRADRFKLDVDAQTGFVEEEAGGGYCAEYGGFTAWGRPTVPEYLIGQYRAQPDVVTDSASSMTSMCSGIKSYNAAINVDCNAQHVVPIARRLQCEGFKIGVVSSVPISHATPAATYANNVTRDDYQDLSRDMLGLPSSSHKTEALSGVDVLIGCGWGETRDQDTAQGSNFVPGNRYLSDQDLKAIDVQSGGQYRVVTRQPGAEGSQTLADAAELAASERQRLFGFFGADNGHLPYQTADGNYDPTPGVSNGEKYEPADIDENPTLAEMTAAALQVLETNDRGFWLMVEAGDVDWANHNDNIDDAIGAVFSGDDAFRVITDWIESHDAWSESAVIVTADHGHYFNFGDLAPFVEAARVNAAARAKK